jgi:hypothetical protein
MKDEDKKGVSEEEGKSLDQEEQVAEAVELSYGRRVLGLGREAKLSEVSPNPSVNEDKPGDPSK